MSLSPLRPPLRRDLFLLLIALVLLTGPLWAPSLHLNDPTYQYSRAEVTANGGNIEYVDEDAVPHRLPISKDIGCLNGQEPRVCSFERLLIENRTVPTGAYTNNPNDNPSVLSIGDRYDYVLIDETVYRTVYVPNRSVQRRDGLYRLDLSLEQVPPEQALESVSIHVEYADLSTPVAQAARSDDVTFHQEVEMPKTPVQLENGTYYRVFLEEQSSDISALGTAIEFILVYGGPIGGLGIISRLSRRVKITYRGAHQQNEK